MPHPPRRSARPVVSDVLWVLVRSLLSEARHRAQPIGLTFPQACLLPAIARRGRITATELSHRSGLSLPGLTSALNFLEARGLVARSRAAGDRRRVHVTLTPAGARLFGRLLRRQHVLHVRINDVFGPADGRAFVAGLRRIIGVLGPGEDLETFPCPLCAGRRAPFHAEAA
ncbi:MAG: MarR family transcriptional regulator [Thermoplasmata archaeon]|nr:MarR family transcriptional regulator [Thermoplasmata archaeon]